jgi:hypothetical protein
MFEAVSLRSGYKDAFAITTRTIVTAPRRHISFANVHSPIAGIALERLPMYGLRCLFPLVKFSSLTRPRPQSSQPWLHHACKLDAIIGTTTTLQLKSPWKLRTATPSLSFTTCQRVSCTIRLTSYRIFNSAFTPKYALFSCRNAYALP